MVPRNSIDSLYQYRQTFLTFSARVAVPIKNNKSYEVHLLRGTILNRTYGTHKKLYTSLFLPTIFGSIYYGPP